MAEEEGAANISIRVPPTKTLEVRWRSLGPSECEKADAVKEMEEDAVQVTACHDALHSVGDGILQSSHVIKYSAWRRSNHKCHGAWY